MVGCSNIAFNERYANAKWNKILIAPFSGDNHNVAEQEFEHAFAISTMFRIVPSSIVKIALEDNHLMDEFNQKPTKTMLKLANILKADGFITATIKTYATRNGNSSDLISNGASIHATLIDAKDMSIVASSQFESSSMFSNTTTLIRDTSLDAIAEFQQAFNKINGIN